MRLWSIHPKYLDSKGIVALWRETLLAKNVLNNNTKGYKNHPQLNRFKEFCNPLTGIDFYLSKIWEESNERGYKFDKDKFDDVDIKEKISVTNKQVEFEFSHLMNKLKTRDKKLYNKFKEINKIDVHPLFEIIEGEIESWERI